MQLKSSVSELVCFTHNNCLRSGVQSGQGAGIAGAKYTFTIKEGADGKNGRISVNYDGFIDDVSVNDMLLVDGGMLSLKILEKTKQDVVCEVVDGGVMGSRYTARSCTTASARHVASASHAKK